MHTTHLPAAFLWRADWVRDVAWAPNFGLPMNTIASAGQDGKVFIWTERQEGARLLWWWWALLGGYVWVKSGAWRGIRC